ncbi:MFS general substrate transporter [Durotheca rogersii]|uniref:MFS general substrate transporter n=1 Tax=Durotheca rogersii TaxID=419775 RepID=UPI002220A642|nr:MFS general substrate transporter [Durotheca rogersii]KAI5863003.1 MFS general substrate transporter [Durotheca rogersii]
MATGEGEMEGDQGRRVSSTQDDNTLVYLPASSEDGRSSPSSTKWDSETQSSAVITSDSGAPFWLTEEFIEDISNYQKAHSRGVSMASSKTLITDRSDMASLVHPPMPTRAPRTNTSDPDRYSLLADLLIDAAPHLRHLAIIGTAESPFGDALVPPRRLGTPVSEQRHPGKPGIKISKSSQPYEPEISEDSGESSRESSINSRAGGTDGELLKGLPLILLIIGLSLVVFLISIDRTIITTAIPFITSEFKSTADIGWYGSSYLLTACAFQPVFGRVYTLFNTKWSYLLSMLFFELGSLISGFAPSSVALIIGRAIAGFGSAGILTGSFVIVATAVPLAARPIYTAVVGLMFGVGATVGPLMGGVFTDLITWRWCFWINLPVGAATMVVMVLVYHPRPRARHQRTVFSRLIDLDLVGNIILLSSAVMLFLALEYTLTGAAWSSASVIGLLCGAGVTTMVLVVWLWWKKDSALIPPAIIKQRTVAASCLMAFFTYGALLIHTYFLPLWFQAILDFSAIKSGVAMIPYFVANALFSVISGVFVSAVGYFTPPAIIGSAIGTVGCGIVSLFHPGMSTAMWIGFEILAAAGFGMSIQQGFTAVQTVLPKDQLAVGTAAVVASQSLGGAVFISVGNSVFQNRLLALIQHANIQDVDVETIIEAGAVAFRKVVPAEDVPALLAQYHAALHTVLIVSIPLGGLAFLSCCFLQWKSVKKAPIEPLGPPSPARDTEKARSVEDRV